MIIPCEWCKGCRSLRDVFRCGVAREGYEDICPCGECLIKMVCNDGCEKLLHMIQEKRNETDNLYKVKSE